MNLEIELYYINLDCRIDRRNKMELQLQEYVKTIPYYRYRAFSSTIKDMYELYQQNYLTSNNYVQALMNHKNNINRGSIGCFMSHLNLLKQCVQTHKIFLILEDDVHIIPSFESTILSMIRSISEFDMIYLEQPTHLWKENCIDYNEYLYKIQQGYFGTFAYIIHPFHATYLIHHLTSIQNHIDNSYLTLNQTKNIYLLKIHILNTDVSTRRNSDVMISKSIQRKKMLVSRWISTIFYFYFQPSSFLIDKWKQFFPLMTFVIVLENDLSVYEISIQKKGFHIQRPLYPIINIIFLLDNIYEFKVEQIPFIYGLLDKNNPIEETLAIPSNVFSFIFSFE